MSTQFDFNPETFVEVTVVAESNGVRLVEIEESAYGVEYPCPGGMTASIYYSWPAALANYQRRYEETTKRGYPMRYTIDVTTPGYPVYSLDQYGKMTRYDEKSNDPGQASQEFQARFPGAVFMEWKAFFSYKKKVDQDLACLAAWNQGV